VGRGRFVGIRRFVRQEVFSTQSTAHFWEQRFLPRWLPLILAFPLGLAVTILTASDLLYAAIAVALVAPVTILLVRRAVDR
jgi:hypothetical protein